MSVLKRRVLTGLVVLGIISALAVAIPRLAAERANNTVALAADATELQNLADLSGLTLPEVLAQARRQGITHVALAEMTLDEAVKALPYPTPRLLPDNVVWQLKQKLPKSEAASDFSGATLTAVAQRLPRLGVGYNYPVAEAIRAAGLQVIARPSPDFSDTTTAIGASLDAVRATGARIVVFNGTQVLGNGGLLKQTASALAARKLEWGFVELIPQEGASELAHDVDYHLVRVHSISEAEMAQKMKPASAIDRYSLAVRERKARVCYVRMFFDQGENPLTANLQYVGDLSQTLRDEGFQLGDPTDFSNPEVGRLARIGLYLGIGAATLWMVQMFFGLSLTWFWGLLVLLVVGSVAEGVVGMRISADLAALAAAVIFPIWGILAVVWPEQPLRSPVAQAVRTFLGISALTLVGALLVAGAITTAPHLMGIEAFRGVKLAAVLPLLLVGLVMVARAMPRYRETRLELGEAAPEIWSLREGLAEAFSFAVRYWHCVLIVVGLAAMVMLVIRSGNDTPVGASELERTFRAILDHLLWVRPRTKEFLFGHPVLLLSLIWLYSGRRRGVWIGLAAGAIGQISLLNTFCHLHTPLMVSLVRSFNGLWLGLGIGLLVWLIITRLTRPAHAPQPQAEPAAPVADEDDDDWDDEEPLIRPNFEEK
ncbi:MAG TPA: DUF5693 family protein [Armatimonadota bacterium]|jgi:hypothetical protein